MKKLVKLVMYLVLPIPLLLTVLVCIPFKAVRKDRIWKNYQQ